MHDHHGGNASSIVPRYRRLDTYTECIYFWGDERGLED